MSRYSSGEGDATIPVGLIVRIAIGVVALLVLLFVVKPMFGYVLAGVGSNQVGIKFYANQPYAVVGPGRYAEPGLFQTLQTIDVEGIKFDASDDEVLTADKQRIGVSVSGTVHRPGVAKSDVLLQNWTNYRTFYTDDAALVGFADKDKDGKPVAHPGLMQQLALQAMKVCVGDLTFDKAVIGAARDTLRECVDKELDRLSSSYGLEVRNIVVPNIVLSKAVQDQLDQITQSRFATEVANQQRLQASAEADKTLATKQGEIRVAQGQVQEKAKQDATTAQLQQQAAVAQAQVIEANKSNEKLTSDRDLVIAQINRQVAAENAQAQLAGKNAEAAIYKGNPEYAGVVNTAALANAYKQTDKIILPAGTNPLTVVGGKDPTVIVGAR